MIKLAEQYGIPKTITREGQKCRLVKITVHENHIVEAAYMKPIDLGEPLPKYLVNQAE